MSDAPAADAAPAPAEGQAPAAAAPAEGQAPAAVAPAAEGQTPEGQSPAGDQPKAEGDAPKAEGEGDKGDAPKAEGPPEEYADFSAPEGVELDAAVLGDFRTVARELGLSQEAAQRVVDLGSQLSAKAAELQASQFEAWKQECVQLLAKDPELGGANLTKTQADMARGRDQFGSPAFVQLLDDFGLSNHPEVVRFLAKVGKEVADDTAVNTGGDISPAQTAAQRLFG